MNFVTIFLNQLKLGLYGPYKFKSNAGLVSDSFLYSRSEIESAMSPIICETIYYIAGWTLNAMRKVSKRRTADFSPILMYVINTCRFSGELVKNTNLPTGKTDSVTTFGAILKMLLIFY